MSSLQFYSNDVCPFAYRVRLMKYTHIDRWLGAMRVRPSVQEHQRDAEFYIEAYKPYVDGTANK